MKIDVFIEKVRKERKKTFEPTAESIYKKFVDLGYERRREKYFSDNASSIIETVRRECWKDFEKKEKNFTYKCLEWLIDDKTISKKNTEDTLKKYVKKHIQFFYELSKSNTQSRRSRAGTEFEKVIEYTLFGAGLPVFTQVKLGEKKNGKKKDVKPIDFVVPGIEEYYIAKSNCVVISSKTTLRERWQEVITDVSNINAGEVFLATVDEEISDDVIEYLYNENIHIITTKNNKRENYRNNVKVRTFEQLIKMCKDRMEELNQLGITTEQNNAIIDRLNKKLEENKDKTIVARTIEKRIKK